MALENIVVYKGPDYHSAFPHIYRLQNSDLVVIFRQARTRPGRGTAGERDETLSHHHLDPDSRLSMVRSTDDGRTWDPDSPVIIDESDGSQDLNMGMIGQLSSGTLLVNNHRWFTGLSQERMKELTKTRSYLPRPNVPPYSEQWFGEIVYDGAYLTRSNDNGHTWGEPEGLSFGDLAFMTHTGKDGVLELPDGTILLMVNGHCADGETGQTFVVRSRDGGRTWGEPSTVANDPEQRVGFGEPPMVRLASGKLLTMMRTSADGGVLYQASSNDDGWVWSGVRRTPIWGFPCHLLQLRSGTVVCVYGYRREPWGVRATLSHDDGETWDIGREIVLRDDGIHRDLGYPASVQLEDDRILTIYYFHGEDGIRHIAGTIWSEDDPPRGF